MTLSAEILLVDDTPQNLQVVGTMLRDWGYRVRVAQDGAQALKMVGQRAPDLILLDIMMPVLDGFETCRRLKGDPATSDIPVIFLTAKTDMESIVNGFELGAVDYLTKPVQFQEVKARVETHLRLRSYQMQLESNNRELIEAVSFRGEVERITRHDLKGPLSVILGYPLLIRKGADNLSEGQMQHLKMIEEAGQKMLGMINRSLDLFKMEQKTYELQPTPVDLVEVARGAMGDLGARADQQGVRMVVEVDDGSATEDGRVMVNGEKLLLYSMTINLLQNALEASPADRTVAVSVSGGDTVTMAIRNTGEVPIDIRDRFFEKYVTAGKASGTGLGTYSARMMAEIHGGSIALDTAEAGVTTVLIGLPGA